MRKPVDKRSAPQRPKHGRSERRASGGKARGQLLRDDAFPENPPSIHEYTSARSTGLWEPRTSLQAIAWYPRVSPHLPLEAAE